MPQLLLSQPREAIKSTQQASPRPSSSRQESRRRTTRHQMQGMLSHSSKVRRKKLEIDKVSQISKNRSRFNLGTIRRPMMKT